MRAIMVMFDTLNRHFLPPYGCDWTVMPNFRRLAERSATFDNCYVGSMPCMPARRELHTGRYNFLHRSWGPLEPFDDSMPELLRNAGVYTHLTSDHAHYWEDGGATYHYRYNSWNYQRGQEGDPCIGQVRDPEMPAVDVKDREGSPYWRHDWINRAHMPDEEDQPQAKTFRGGMDFIRRNYADDNWFLQIETFDPHEPFFTQQHYKDLYPHDYRGKHFDWPPYRQVRESEDEVAHIRYEYAALLSMCDRWLGEILSLMDELAMWDDTMLIVNTDHGFLLGEHDYWAKCHMPWYNEMAHTPLFIWDPRHRVAGERRQALVQTIDLAPTLLDFFGCHRPAAMQGRPLGATVAGDTAVREGALFGQHGAHVNVTDGRYVYMRAPTAGINGPLYNYTLMPTHMHEFFRPDELRAAELAPPLPFTKGMPVLRTPANLWKCEHDFRTMLFDLHADPEQLQPLDDPAIERRMIELLRSEMAANDAPPEQYQRLGIG